MQLHLTILELLGYEPLHTALNLNRIQIPLLIIKENLKAADLGPFLSPHPLGIPA